MLIFVYGDDSFRAQEKVRHMTRAFREKFDPTGLNLSEYPMEGQKKLDLAEVLGAVRAFPFLGQKRMVVIRDLIANTKKDEMKAWVEGLEKTPESTIVIFWETLEPKALEKKPLYKELSSKAEVHQYTFPQFQGSDLGKWITLRVRKRDGVISTESVWALVERVGADLWQMDGEIAKLTAYAHGKPITIEMIDELVHASFEGKIFSLIDAVSQRRPAQALRLLQEERWSGANDHYLLTMLGRQVRILLCARALLDEKPYASKQELADVVRVHPFVAQKALEQAKRFELTHLKEVHDLLFDFDLKLKTGGIDAELAVDLTTVKLTE